MTSTSCSAFDFFRIALKLRSLPPPQTKMQLSRSNVIFRNARATIHTLNKRERSTLPFIYTEPIGGSSSNSTDSTSESTAAKHKLKPVNFLVNMDSGTTRAGPGQVKDRMKGFFRHETDRVSLAKEWANINKKKRTVCSQMIDSKGKISSISPEELAQDIQRVSKDTQKFDIQSLFQLLPQCILRDLEFIYDKSKDKSEHFQPFDSTSKFYDSIIEIYFHVGQHPRLIFRDGSYIDLKSISTRDEVKRFIQKLSASSLKCRNSQARWTSDLRIGISNTLHRIGLFLDKTQENILGCTIRIGRYIPHAGILIADLMKIGSTVIIAPPCTGKTTIIRDTIAQLCNSADLTRVVVVDTSNEIIGDSDEPAPYFGTVRRLQVPERESQPLILSHAVQNHSPEVVIIDEVGNTEECESICSIIHRGSKVLCSVHGSSLASVVRNLKLNTLFGGSQPLLLSYDEKRAKQKTRKTALERMNPTGFDFAIQLRKGEFQSALLYLDLNKVVDSIYDKEDWLNGGKEFAFSVDLTKSIKEQACYDEILKIFNKCGLAPCQALQT